MGFAYAGIRYEAVMIIIRASGRVRKNRKQCGHCCQIVQEILHKKGEWRGESWKRVGTSRSVFHSLIEFIFDWGKIQCFLSVSPLVSCLTSWKKENFLSESRIIFLVKSIDWAIIHCVTIAEVNLDRYLQMPLSSLFQGRIIIAHCYYYCYFFSSSGFPLKFCLVFGVEDITMWGIKI